MPSEAFQRSIASSFRLAPSVLTPAISDLFSARAVRNLYPSMKSLAANHLTQYEDMGADVGVLVRSSVVAVQVEQAVVPVLIVVTTAVQHNTRSVVVAVVAHVAETEDPARHGREIP